MQRRTSFVVVAAGLVAALVAEIGCASPATRPAAVAPRSDRPIPAPAPAPTPANPATPAPTAAATEPPLTPAALDAWVAGQLAGRLPSAMVGIVELGGAPWTAAVGAADAAHGPPPTRATRYRIGSLTKLVTGIALLQLRDAKKLDLDDPVARWVPQIDRRITLRHLVTHTAGIPSLGDGSAPYWSTTPPTEAQLLAALRGPPVFEPGAQSAYSNAGMALAGVVVARASGTSYRDYVTTRVLRPAGLATAVWDRPAKDLAIGTAGGPLDPPHWQLGAFEPAGGLYLSADDMIALARLALGGVPAVHSDAARRAAQTDDPLPGRHGVAWIVAKLGSERIAAHTGSTTDYTASLVVAPDRGIAAFVLASGPQANLVDCAAVALLRAALRDRAPEACP